MLDSQIKYNKVGSGAHATIKFFIRLRSLTSSKCPFNFSTISSPRARDNQVFFAKK